jgi:mono/diheme cytochrome c family protein
VRLPSLAKWTAIAGTMGIALGAIGGVGFVKSGIYDVGAAAPHTRFTEWLTHETMIHSVKRHAEGIAAPARFTPDQVATGFCAYETHCVACHGAAAVGREQWVSGMEPAPPYLLDISQRFTRPQLFWIVKNGIKMTGMPAWKNSMSDAEIWGVVAWLEEGPRLPPQTYVRWRSERKCGPAIGLPSPSPALSPTPRLEPARPIGATGGSAPSSRASAPS